MQKIKKIFEKVGKKLDDILFYSIVFGVILLSAGVYIMGSRINPEIGRDLIILGSGLFYISVIIFTFRL
jgi:ABC-type Mn2+/Zn2+ transport system permease subunit